MARFQFHFGFLNSSLLPHRSSIKETQIEVFESGSECGEDLKSSSVILPEVGRICADGREERGQEYSVMANVAALLRKSLVMCSVGAGEEGFGGSMEIGRPTDVQHIAHVTFDRFDGFLGLPLEFHSDISGEVPSASVSAFGVSAKSMQCSNDSRGNSVPTILLTMQRYLYSQGGLKAEGIFRINSENRQEVLAREQLNKGLVPLGVDLHCLAGLIKAWFRELPSGVLDSLTPEQVINCNTEEDCCQLIRVLPPTESALLDWAINLMADVVQHEHHNKMNARNIAMVFAPNMTQMADPLTALIHAVQIMNFLKTLIVQKLREREKAAAKGKQFLRSCNLIEVAENSSMVVDGGTSSPVASNLNSFGILFNIEDCSDSDANESFRSFEKRSEVEDGEFFSGRCSSDLDVVRDGIRCRNGYKFFE